MGKIFGGYTDIPWQADDDGDEENNIKQGNGNSFIFSLREDFNFVKLRCLKKEMEVQHNENFLCVFGNDDNGFKIANECNINTDSSSDLGCNEEYELPYGIN